MKEDIEVDYKELNKQRKEEIIKKGDFALCEIVVESVNNEEEFRNSIPIVELELRHVGTVEIASLLFCLETVTNNLIELSKEKGHYDRVKKVLKDIRLYSKVSEVTETNDPHRKESKDE